MTPRIVNRAGLALALVAVLLPIGPAADAKVPVGETATIRIESPHPYPNGASGHPVVWSHTLHHPGATFVKLHVARLDVGPGDSLRLVDGLGRLVAEYSEPDNRRGAFWASSTEGDTVTIELRADAAGAGWGVSINRYGYGTTPLSIESICGVDQREDVACYAGTPIEDASRAVGRMLFQEGGIFFLCTGFLISSRDHFLSNQHCISTPEEAASLEVRFNFQRQACGGTPLAPFETFTGARLLLKNAPLDMSLLTLEGRPSATFGFLPLSDRDPALGEALYLPQHAQGGPKQVSVTDCEVSTPVIDGLAPNSDIGHTCDTRPGSSGSPVLDLTNQVVALHHFSGCMPAGGQNQAVRMSRILPLLPPRTNVLALRSATLLLDDGGGDALKFRGRLALGLASDGIDPLTEPVTLTLADADGPFYSATVPAGRFRRAGRRFAFRDRTGTLANGLHSLVLRGESSGEMAVSASGRGLDLSGAGGQAITLTLEIGNDTAVTTETFRARSRALAFP